MIQEHVRPFDPNTDIFVFGSNLEGLHLAGAAKFAHQSCGAEWGKGSGPVGRSYAIPTMHGFEVIAEEVRGFLSYAREHSQQSFFVTRIGCGIAGYSDAEIAPLFKDSPDNVVLPIGWFDQKISNREA